MSERFLTLSEARSALKVSRATLWRWTQNGLRVVRVGGVTRIRESDLQAFLSRHETGAECAESQVDGAGTQSA